MASIGVRFDNNNSGADLATMLAKAMYGSPMDRYNAANIMSEIENRTADTGYRQALTRASNAELAAKQGAIGAISHNIQTAAGGQFGAQPPEIVQPPPAAQPAAATPPPEIVAPPVQTRQQMPSMFGSDAPAIVEPTARAEPDFRMPGSYAFDRSRGVGSEPPVPVEPDYRTSSFPAPPEPPKSVGELARNRMGGDYIGHPDAPALIDPQTAIDTSQGAQVVVPGRNAPAPIDMSAAAPATTIPGGVRYDAAGASVPATAPAPAPAEPPAARISPIEPAPLAPSPTPPPPATPEQKQIAATQPPAQVPPGQMVNHGDGTVTVGTPNGPRRMPAEDADAIAALVVFSSDPGGQAAKFEGQAGLLYNPANKLTPTETLATLASGGSELSKTSAAANTAGGTGTQGAGGFQGTDMTAQDANLITTITQKMLAGQKLTPQEAIQYAGSYDRGWGQPKWHQMADPNSPDPDHPDMIDVPVYPTPPPGTPSVADAYRAAGLPVPSAGTGASGGNAVIGGTPAPGGAAPVTGGAGQPMLGAGFVTKKGGAVQPTGPQAQDARYLNAMTTANADIGRRTAADLLLPVDEEFTNPTKYTNSTMASMYSTWRRMKDPKIAKYWGEAMDFATAILRDESGAATRPEDMKTVMERYIPMNGDSPEVFEKKALRRQIAIQGMHDGAFPGATPQERLASSDAYLTKVLGEGALLNDKYAAATPAPATTATPTPAPATTATPTPAPANQALEDALKKY